MEFIKIVQKLTQEKINQNKENGIRPSFWRKGLKQSKFDAVLSGKCTLATLVEVCEVLDINLLNLKENE